MSNDMIAMMRRRQRERLDGPPADPVPGPKRKTKARTRPKAKAKAKRKATARPKTPTGLDATPPAPPRQLVKPRDLAPTDCTF